MAFRTFNRATTVKTVGHSSIAPRPAADPIAAAVAAEQAVVA